MSSNECYKKENDGSLWFYEQPQADIKHAFTIEEELVKTHSEFQSIKLVKSGPYGKILLLDNLVQSAEADECIYHELLVHPAMLHHQNPKTVFISGGGEGFTAREVLRHKSVEKVVMVDIDKAVCDFCKENYLVSKKAFEDPKLKLLIDDAGKYLENTNEKFDVIINDLCDPIKGNPCYQLYSYEFYKDVIKNRLNDNGIFVTQSSASGITSCQFVFTPIAKTIQSTFEQCLSYSAHIPSFNDSWGFNLGLPNNDNIKKRTKNEIDELIKERIGYELKYFDGETWIGVSSLNKILKQKINDETDMITNQNFKFLYGSGKNAEK